MLKFLVVAMAPQVCRGASSVPHETKQDALLKAKQQQLEQAKKGSNMVLVDTLKTEINVMKTSFRTYSTQPCKTQITSGVRDHVDLPSQTAQWTYDNWLSEVKKSDAELRNWRQTLHKEPELMFQEKNISKFVTDKLQEWGIKFTDGLCKNPYQHKKAAILSDGPGGYGVLAEIGTGSPCVMLRADMDGLPIVENFSEEELPFKSIIADKGHLCGHDAHTTMLLGAAKFLKRMKDENRLPPGTIKFMFQPAEEGGAGALEMIKDGILEGENPVDRAIGFHVNPWASMGEIGSGPGFFFAGCEDFTFEIQGTGGHAGYPHETNDPIVASAAVITAVQSIVSRNLDPNQGGLISITAVEAGQTNVCGVIPEKVIITGTCRSGDVSRIQFLKEKLQKVAIGVAQGHGCTAQNFKFNDPWPSYPPLTNDAYMWDWLQSTAKDASTSGKVERAGPYMLAEDFGFISEKVPSLFIMLGVDSSGKSDQEAHGLDSNLALHNPRFNLDERILTRGAALHSHLAVQSLVDLANKRSEL